MTKIIKLIVVGLLAFSLQGGHIIYSPTPASSPCDPRGVYNFYYDADNTDDTDGCVAAGDLQGTENVSAVSSDQNHTTGGAKSMLVGSDNEHIYFPRTGIVSSTEGYISLWFYPTAVDQGFVLFEMRYDAGDRIAIVHVAGGATYGYHYSDGAAHYTAVGGTCNANAWNSIAFRWDTANDDLDISLNGEAWQEDADAIAPFVSGETTNFYLGESAWGGTGTADVYIDDVYITDDFSP